MWGVCEVEYIVCREWTLFKIHQQLNRLCKRLRKISVLKNKYRCVFWRTQLLLWALKPRISYAFNMAVQYSLSLHMCRHKNISGIIKCVQNVTNYVKAEVLASKKFSYSVHCCCQLFNTKSSQPVAKMFVGNWTPEQGRAINFFPITEQILNIYNLFWGQMVWGSCVHS